MGGFTLRKMTFGSLFKKPETIQYPVQKKEPPAGLKGHVTNKVEACILCGICMKKCSTDAINVDKESRLWSIDYFRCVQCYACVRSCPKKCLDMEPTYPAPSAKKSIASLHVPEQPKPEKKENKLDGLDPEKAAKVKAALEAKAKREAEKAAAANGDSCKDE